VGPRVRVVRWLMRSIFSRQLKSYLHLSSTFPTSFHSLTIAIPDCCLRYEELDIVIRLISGGSLGLSEGGEVKAEFHAYPISHISNNASCYINPIFRPVRSFVAFKAPRTRLSNN